MDTNQVVGGTGENPSIQSISSTSDPRSLKLMKIPIPDIIRYCRGKAWRSCPVSIMAQLSCEHHGAAVLSASWRSCPVSIMAQLSCQHHGTAVQ